jgi:hypothetical protein
MTDTWTPPDAPRARAEREYAALFRIHQRHANDPARRDRGRHPAMIGPAEAVRLLVGLAAGSIVAEDGEDAVDAADLTAALTLMPMVRAEVDQFEASLLMIARGQGMTWQQLAFGLGLGSAQAARQRYERLALRAAPDQAPASPHHDGLRHISRDIVYGLIRTRHPRSIQIGRLPGSPVSGSPVRCRKTSRTP